VHKSLKNVKQMFFWQNQPSNIWFYPCQPQNVRFLQEKIELFGSPKQTEFGDFAVKSAKTTQKFQTYSFLAKLVSKVPVAFMYSENVAIFARKCKIL